MHRKIVVEAAPQQPFSELVGCIFFISKRLLNINQHKVKLLPSIDELNPCFTCGACCANYRISFYWSEGDDTTPGGVPVALTEKLGNFRLSMIGTSGTTIRCIALKGTVGDRVQCTIYNHRSSVCRNYNASWFEGFENLRCDEARAAWGLLPLN